MFKKILIANRGEIACRVIKTARRMGIKTVAVYSEADRNALHVEMADEAVCIGPAASAQSYLNMNAILDAIKQTQADAVHPGYGFLSENAAFARKLARNKIAFIGPKPLAMTSMGDKIESKKLAEKAGVNTIPGHTEALRDAKQAVSVAKKVGYPVMLKASAGGGGKGMRIARNDDEARDGFRSAVREAKSSFGDDRVFIEKYIEQPRHIEIQIMADGHGNVIHLGERECSIQRRHQKVIEEAPSSFIDEDMRNAMGEQAVALSRAVKYQSAGTVEFIVDGNHNFYFLEMNTRLQVEHPVTEMVTGLDLVELMIRVADGQKLPLTQEQVTLTGWAIEARVYAEDPFRNFLPSTGRLVRYRAPDEGNGIRVDTGVYEGGEISIHYDPMIAKLIAYGETRDEASERMRQALDAYYIRGVSHNISFLAALIAHPRFRSGDITTNLIAEEYPDGFHPADGVHDDPAHMVAVAASMHFAYQSRAAETTGQVPGFSRVIPEDWTALIDERQFPVSVHGVEGGYDVTVDGRTLQVRTGWQLGGALFEASIDGVGLTLQVKRGAVSYQVLHAGSQADIHILTQKAAEMFALMPVKEPPDLSQFLLSPMPGLLISVAVEAGAEVKSGEELAVVEAMKMENVLRAERDGVVKVVHCEAADSLAVDQVILEFE